MQAERAAHWVVYVAPLIAIYLVWKSYDKLLPKILWTGIIFVSYLLLPPYGFASISIVILLIHLFVFYFHEQRKSQEEANRLNEKILESIRENNKNIH